MNDQSRTMNATHRGSFETDEHYGGEYQLEDGTLINVLTVITGPGCGAEIEIECDRAIAEEECDAVLAADEQVDHFSASGVEYTKRKFRRRY